jgi:hypothetical protein
MEWWSRGVLECVDINIGANARLEQVQIGGFFGAH